MKTKILALLLVTVIVAAGAAIAAFTLSDDGNESQNRSHLTTTLQVYGNADGNWTVNRDDANLIQKIIDSNSDDDTSNDIDWKSQYPFADADHNGIIDSDDKIQAEALANNTATYVCFNDGLGEFMKVKTNPQRIYTFQVQNAQICAIMGVGDHVVAGGPPIENYADILFGEGKSKSGQWFSGDWEKMAKLNLDMYLVFSPTQKESPTQHLPDTDVVYLGLYEPNCVNLESSVWAQGILEAGYIFGNKERAEDYLSFLINLKNAIYSISSQISDEDKERILVSNYGHYLTNENDATLSAYLKADTVSQAVELAGGYNVAQENDGYSSGAYGSRIEAEWLNDHKVDFITMHFQRYSWKGVDTSVPVGGWTATDASGMYEAIADVANQPLLVQNNIDKNHLIMLPQEFRNGSTGGIMAAAYFVQAFYPKQCEKAGFDPDDYMEKFCVNWLSLEGYDFSEHRDAIIAWGDRPRASD